MPISAMNNSMVMPLRVPANYVFGTRKTDADTIFEWEIEIENYAQKTALANSWSNRIADSRL